ncbi:unnamed protein product, partial [Scytosiphon promiscuus]
MVEKGRRASVNKGAGKRAEEANDLVHFDFCGPYSTSLGGNCYMLYAVNSATRHSNLYSLRRWSEELAVFKR